MEATSYDQNFYTHELDEAGRYAQLGYGPEWGTDLGNSEMYDVWNNVTQRRSRTMESRVRTSSTRDWRHE